MQYTTNYNLNKPEGTDIVNPLTVDNPNWDSIDTAMYTNKQNSVQVAQVALQETTIAITRDKSKPSMFRFIATMNYSTNMTITVDGTSVTATMPDGSALASNAFRIGSNVLCSLNGTALTIYTNPSIDTNALKTAILQAVFPVGSIYTNINDSTNPATTFGFGTWERIQGQFILGASATHGAGTTGGSESVVIAKENLPDLTLPVTTTVRNGSVTIDNDFGNQGDRIVTNKGATNTKITNLATVSLGGSGTGLDTMPPYVAAYIWKRTA